VSNLRTPGDEAGLDDQRTPGDEAEPTERPRLAPLPLTVPDPPLSDEVVTLRPLRDDDAEAVQRACSDPITQRWLDFLPRSYDLDDARWFIGHARSDWQAGHAAVFAIADAHDDTLLGAVAVQAGRHRRPFVGYWVGPWARGRGVAPRAVTLVSTWALQTLDVVRLELFVEVGNVASERVAGKAGFQREGILRSYDDGHDGPIDLVMFSLLPSDLDPAA
jgi:RimJ/RimL family protein N-acetyltransferase